MSTTLDVIISPAVYAVGLYVDPKAAKHLLSSKQADISAKQGIPEQGVFDGMNILWPASSVNYGITHRNIYVDCLHAVDHAHTAPHCLPSCSRARAEPPDSMLPFASLKILSDQTISRSLFAWSSALGESIRRTSGQLWRNG